MPEAATPVDAGAWESWPIDAKRRFLMKLRDAIDGGWRAQARPDQLPPDSAWSTLLLRGGRGSGKSWAGAHIFREEIESDPLRDVEGPGQWAIVAPTFADARDKCVESDESGLLMALGTNVREVKAGTSATVAVWNRSIGELHLHDGTRIYIDGADDGAYRIQGYNLRGIWCDEIGLWKQWETAWDESIGYALRKGRARRIATGTPKRIMPARKLMRRLLADPKVVSRRLRTFDNLDNLSDTFRENVRRHEGTELGRQELEGELLEDVEGALWKRAWFEAETFRAAAPYGGWARMPVTGVDPSDGTETGAEHAYSTVALGQDNDLYVVANEGRRTSPYEFAVEVVRHSAAHGSVIVLEKNHGGAWLVEVFERAMMDTGVRRPLRVISAAVGKRTRAEPVAALYEPRKSGGKELPGRVHHMETFEELEDQLTGWTGSPGEESPDRLDSLVWALSDFTGLTFEPAPTEDRDRAVPYANGNGNGRRKDSEAEMAVAWQ